MKLLEHRRLLTGLILAAVCIAYVAAVWALHPTCFFGLTHDDMLYFTSAKAIAEHNGYISPSLPGAPPATKYPVLYPWLLSWVWRWNPSFPANLSAAVWLNILFGLIFILASFELIRRAPDISNSEVLLLTAFVALHPIVLFYSGVIMAEVPFAALALVGLVIADSAMQPDSPTSAAVGCGALFALTILVRTAGVPLALGVFVSAIFRRAWKPAFFFAAIFVPLIVALFWRSVLLVPPAPFTGTASLGAGWRQAWLYHTDYVAFRRLASPNIHMVGQLVLNQVLYFPSDVAGYFLAPWAKSNLALWFVTTSLTFAAVGFGWLRIARASRWAPLHVGAALYILSLMFWDYPDWQRFLLAFFPIIALSLWVECKRWILQSVTAIRRLPHLLEKMILGSSALVYPILLLAVLWNYAGPSRVWSHSVSQQREQLLGEKKEAYEWLSHNAPAGDRVIAMEDGTVYLYAGLQSMVPIVPLPGGIYDRNQAKSDMDHMMDVAQAIRARYWVAAPDDFENTQKFFRPLLTARSHELQTVLPSVFRSSDGRVVIYELSCVRQPAAPTCEKAASVLFPDGLPTRISTTTQDLPHQ